MIRIQLITTVSHRNRGMFRYRVRAENGARSLTESRFSLDRMKNAGTRALAPKRHGACDSPRSTAPWLFRSGARSARSARRPHQIDRFVTRKKLVTFFIEATRPKVLIVADHARPLGHGV